MIVRKSVIIFAVAVLWAAAAFAQTSSSDLTGLGMPGELASSLARTSVSCTSVNTDGDLTLSPQGDLSVVLPVNKALLFEQPAGTSWLRAQRDQDPLSNQILEVTIPGSDNNNNKFIYVTASDYVDVSSYPRGATLELSGNDAEPAASRGVVHLFTGANPNGRIGLNVMHASGQIHALDVVTTTIAYTPSSGIVDLSRNLTFQPVSTTPYKVKDNIGVLRATQTGTNARACSATLVAGSKVIANTSVTANTKVFLNRAAIGGTAGNLSYSVVANTSFTISSSNGADTSTIDWYLMEFES